MKKSLITLALAALLSSPAFAADQYLVRVPANVNLSAAAPETPQEPISLSLSAEALPVGTVGEPYSFNLLDRLTITGGSGSHNYSNTAWSLKTGDALPPGLSLSGSMIAGTPTAKNEAGTSFEVTGTYQDASGQQVYTIVVGGEVLRVTQIAAGGEHTCAVTTSSEVMCWGNNGVLGLLGNSTSGYSKTPTAVDGLNGDVITISAGVQHNCALLNSGQVKCWGNNNLGQLGDGTTVSRTVPTDVLGLNVEVRQISVGANHTCVVTALGGIKCWGFGNSGRLGNGGIANSSIPVDVVGLQSNAAYVSAGNASVCALTTSGAVMCWGYNGSGQLGDGSTTNRLTPVAVSGLSSGVSVISVGHAHACAVTTSGAAMCWGNKGSGRLGDGAFSTANRLTPEMVSGLNSGIASISAGVAHTCAVTNAGAAMCWGYNVNGQLGDGTISAKAMPVSVSSLALEVAAISAGSNHTCAVMTSGVAKCWGHNNLGQLGDGTTTSRTIPVDVLP